MTAPPPPLELAAAELRRLGITLARLPGKYRVNFRNGADATARMAETLDEAVELGRSMAAEAPAPARPAQGKRRRRPLRMTPKAVCRRMIRKHNHRMRARALRGRLTLAQSGRAPSLEIDCRMVLPFEIAWRIGNQSGGNNAEAFEGKSVIGRAFEALGRHRRPGRYRAESSSSTLTLGGEMSS